jgi:hypothetical protein
MSMFFASGTIIKVIFHCKVPPLFFDNFCLAFETLYPFSRIHAMLLHSMLDF